MFSNSNWVAYELAGERMLGWGSSIIRQAVMRDAVIMGRIVENSVRILIYFATENEQQLFLWILDTDHIYPRRIAPNSTDLEEGELIHEGPVEAVQSLLAPQYTVH